MILFLAVEIMFLVLGKQLCRVIEAENVIVPGDF